MGRAAVWLGTELGVFVTQRGAVVPSTHPLDFYWFDAMNYRQIWLNGYSPLKLTAFFPLFPYSVRALGHLIGTDAAGLVIPNLALAVALVLFRAEAESRLGEERAGLAVWALAVWPWSCFFTYPFTESLFLLAALLAYRLIAGRRWVLAGVAGALAAATRGPGVLLALAFAAEIGQGWRQGLVAANWRKIAPMALGLLIVPLGLVAVALVDQRAVGDPLAFLHAQRFWHFPRNPLFPLGQTLLVFRDFNPYKTEGLGLPVAAAFAAGAWWSLKNLPWRYSAFAIALGLVVVYDGWQQGQFYSVPRWLLVDFPCFFGFAALLGRYEQLRLPWFALSGALLVIESALYGAHHFIG